MKLPAASPPDEKGVGGAGRQPVPHGHHAAAPHLGRQGRLGPQELAPGGAQHAVEEPGDHGLALGVLRRREGQGLFPPSGCAASGFRSPQPHLRLAQLTTRLADDTEGVL